MEAPNALLVNGMWGIFLAIFGHMTGLMALETMIFTR